MLVHFVTVPALPPGGWLLEVPGQGRPATLLHGLGVTRLQDVVVEVSEALSPAARDRFSAWSADVGDAGLRRRELVARPLRRIARHGRGESRSAAMARRSVATVTPVQLCGTPGQRLNTAYDRGCLLPLWGVDVLRREYVAALRTAALSPAPTTDAPVTDGAS